MTHRINSILVLGILILVSMACNFSFSTANLSELKFGKDKDANGAGATFNPNDLIFAVTAVNNASGKNKVKFRLLFDKVEGAQSGTVAYKLEKELPVEDSREVWFSFSVPSGFVPGSYKVEAVLTDEAGKELDRKTGNLTIAGDNSGKNTTPRNQSSDEPNTETDKTRPANSEDQ